MGMLSGSITFSRFRPTIPPGTDDTQFITGAIELLQANALGLRPELANLSNGVSIGWAAGDHYGDRNFTYAKQSIEDCLFAQMVTAGPKYPAEKLKSYFEEALAEEREASPRGTVSPKARKKAKDAAAERLIEEGKDGRFLRRKLTDILWDPIRNEVLVGSTSRTDLARARALFGLTFGADIVPLTSGELARAYATDETLADLLPTMFHDPDGDAGDQVVKWAAALSDRDYLGNEFVFWLWFQCNQESAVVRLGDFSEVAIFFSRTLVIEDPRGSSGRDTFSHEGPGRLPEAFRGIQSGKLPRKVGLTLVRADRQYTATLNPEAMAVTGLKVPRPEEDNLTASARASWRQEANRDFRAILDGLFGSFCSERFAPSEWARFSSRAKNWLEKGDRKK